MFYDLTNGINFIDGLNGLVLSYSLLIILVIIYLELFEFSFSESQRFDFNYNCFILFGFI